MNRAELRVQITRCTRCPLHAQATSPVPFRGPANPKLLVVGEAPGRWEDRAGRPFVGPSGSLMGRYLAQAGFNVIDEVAFANTICCFPNRPLQTPTWGEVDACAKNLDDQLEYLNPERVLLCGLTAVGAFWPNIDMKSIRGRWFTVKKHPTMATYHPAAVLRDPGLMPVVFEDIAKMMLGPGLTSRDRRDYECVKCAKEAQVWVSEGMDVTRQAGGLGIGWCVRCVRGYRRKYRGAGGGAVQQSLEYA